ncbi:MAG TPA: primosomal protein N' [Thermomicrobiales bacterium]|nr:primosomal protein N' [Thermomicrobiales bacterium]
MTDGSTASTAYAEVAPDARLTGRHATLTYSVPPHLDCVEVGQLIWAPLRRRLVLGIVVERHRRPPEPRLVPRDVHALVEPTFCLAPLQWNLAVWLAEETLCTLFDAAAPMLPPGVNSRAVEHLVLERPPSASERSSLTRSQLTLVDLLATEGELTLERAQRSLGSSLASIISALETRGLVQRVARVRNRPPDAPKVRQQVRLVAGAGPPPARAVRQLEAFEWLSQRLRARPDRALPIERVLDVTGVDRAVLRALERRGCVAIEDMVADDTREPRSAGDVELTPEQLAAWSEIAAELRSKGAGARRHVLLHGVTGSGKTELYLRVAADVLARGASTLLLVPEIGLTGQIGERVRERFGNLAIVIHSALNDRDRSIAWNRAASGEPLVVVGPRSALFAPAPRVGAIILDEEHDSSFKQDSTPRYHARSVARKLAELHDSLLILGSATPDVETFRHSSGPGWTRITLSSRVGQRAVDRSGLVRPMSIPAPVARIIDMRAELRAGNTSIFSRLLRDTIQSRLDANEQTILFLNRRGASTLVQCRSCGTVSSCPFCDIPLVYHRTTQRVMCHRCGHREAPPTRCQSCGSDAISYYGAGAQRVEAEVRQQFPAARVLRWDHDAIRGSTTHDALRARVMRHEVDIIVGTQMVSKGLDIAGVTAVGVVNADTYLYLPDIRSAERTFQMLTQVSGRAGRRSGGGAVVLQTYSPQHYAVTSAAAGDYLAFYREEIEYRRSHGYPPFKRLARLLYRNSDETRCQAVVEEMADRLERHLIAHPEISGVDLVGPAPAFSARVRNRYGWQILVRGDQLLALLSGMTFPPGWIVDVDPQNLL